VRQTRAWRRAGTGPDASAVPKQCTQASSPPQPPDAPTPARRGRATQQIRRPVTLPADAFAIFVHAAARGGRVARDAAGAYFRSACRPEASAGVPIGIARLNATASERARRYSRPQTLCARIGSRREAFAATLRRTTMLRAPMARRGPGSLLRSLAGMHACCSGARGAEWPGRRDDVHRRRESASSISDEKAERCTPHAARLLVLKREANCRRSLCRGGCSSSFPFS
jgi:hypothetical protein